MSKDDGMPTDAEIEDHRKKVRAEIIGNLQAQAALSFLGLGINPIVQTLLLWNGKTMNLKKLHYRKDANCEICSQPSAITDVI